MIIVLISYYLELIDILRYRGFRGRAPRVGATTSGLPGPSTQGGCYIIWASGAEHPGWVLHHLGFRGRAPRVGATPSGLPGPSTQGGCYTIWAFGGEHQGWLLHCRSFRGRVPRVGAPPPRHRRYPARGREKGGRRPFAVAFGAVLLVVHCLTGGPPVMNAYIHCGRILASLR